MFRSASSSPQPTPVPSLPLARASLPAGETGTEWKRGRASVRCSNATTPTISNEPTSAETISFWASHSSPCPPSHCTPFPGATISATMLSMISKQPLTARMIPTGNAKLQTPRRIPLNRKSNSRIGNASRNPNAPWAKTVVMIAREMEKIFRPNSERHFLIGLIAAMIQIAAQIAINATTSLFDWFN